MGDPLAIEVRGLVKTFGSVAAVRDFDFTVQPGRVTGFLGPNGAGKTTTLRIVLDLVAATAGTATFGGRRYRDLPDPVRQVGAVLEATNFHPSRSARSHLRILATTAGIEHARVDAVLQLVGLGELAGRKVGNYSMGMRQRLQLAAALLGDPGVLILDEPSNGLDPQGMAWLRGLLRVLAGEGRTVLVSSHLLAEMAQTVDDVIIVSTGEVRAKGPLATLTASLAHTVSVRVRSPEADRLFDVCTAAGFRPSRAAVDTVMLVGIGPEVLGPVLAENRIVIHEMTSEARDLESVFMELTRSLQPPPGWVPPGWVPPGEAPPGEAPAGEAPAGEAPAGGAPAGGAS